MTKENEYLFVLVLSKILDYATGSLVPIGIQLHHWIISNQEAV